MTNLSLSSTLFGLSFWYINAIGTTTVTVLELGKGGSVRRTTSSNNDVSVGSVFSFWSSLHTDVESSLNKDSFQSGLSMVPDMFQKPDSGIVVGFFGNEAPTKKVVSKIGKHIGEFNLSGNRGSILMNKASPGYVVDEPKALRKIKNDVSVENNKLHAVALDSTVKSKELYSELVQFLKDVESKANDSGSTILIYLVSEERGMKETHHRMLEEENADDDAAGNQNGYGYYNDYGEWVTSYKTIFQIQYYNVVLWTTLGLTVVTYASNYMLAYMPLMEDTLLFGETAKMSAQ